MTEPTNTTGPRGTYGCACLSRDGRQCALLRYGWGDLGDLGDCDPRERDCDCREREDCECLCHEWQADDDLGRTVVRAGAARRFIRNIAARHPYLTRKKWLASAT